MKTRMVYYGCLLGIVLLTRSAASGAQVPGLVNYQGRLVNSNGVPLATGDYELHFSLWDAATGGTQVWGPQHFDNTPGHGHGAKVPAMQGWFNVILGPVDTTGASLTDAFNATNCYLEIRVGTNPPVLPRQQILSAPYALRSGKAQQAEIASLAVLAETANTALQADIANVARRSESAHTATNALNGLPAGSILPFAGSTEPPGFMACDGRALRSEDFPHLFAAIGQSWGSGGGANDFNLPDLRGVFLRGIDGGRGLDPESGARSSINGGNSGNNVGSYQPDSFQDHVHSTDLNPRNDWPTSGSGATRVVSTEAGGGRLTQGAANGRVSSETRPKNAYVNYIIKY